MIWTGPSEDQRSTREGRSLQIKKHTDGTYRLLVWKTPAGSAIVGIFSAPEVARAAAEKTPLDDASLAKLMQDPHAAMKERWQ